jgi:hypothetical protein
MKPTFPFQLRPFPPVTTSSSNEAQHWHHKALEFHGIAFNGSNPVSSVYHQSLQEYLYSVFSFEAAQLHDEMLHFLGVLVFVTSTSGDVQNITK